jgi:hypothetical protein
MQSVERESKPEPRKSDIQQYFMSDFEVSCSAFFSRSAYSDHMIDRPSLFVSFISNLFSDFRLYPMLGVCTESYKENFTLLHVHPTLHRFYHIFMKF